MCAAQSRSAPLRSVASLSNRRSLHQQRGGLLSGGYSPSSLLLVTFVFCSVVIGRIDAFNLDVDAPIYKVTNRSKDYFGFSVAFHFRDGVPLILAGAPRAESGQPNTTQAGALFACPLNTAYNGAKNDLKWCDRLSVEYPVGSADAKLAPRKLLDRYFYGTGKNYQLLGYSVSSQPTNLRTGQAVVCAPLLRFQKSAYTQGICYVLNNDLTFAQFLSACERKQLDKKDRHNEFGACLEGMSVRQRHGLLVSGVPGARKWTGGVYAMRPPTDNFSEPREKYTMGVDSAKGGVHAVLTSHDYLGYSVDVGRFGFAHERHSAQALTLVSGAPRRNATGAVVFLPYTDTSSTELVLTGDQYVLDGPSGLGSYFGYSLEVADVSGDGWDDLIVGAPFDDGADDGASGGTVYVYFSSGKQRGEKENHLVFLKPVILRAGGRFAQFGISLAWIGRLRGQKSGPSDFAVGAPYDDQGKGAVYIFHGAASPEKMSDQPVQVIRTQSLPSPLKGSLRTWGWSLSSGGADIDSNRHPDLLVGAFSSGHVVALRSRPVVNLDVRHIFDKGLADIDGANSNCPQGSVTCFDIELELKVSKDGTEEAAVALNLNSADEPFMCTLKVKRDEDGRKRALIQGDAKWPCGRSSHRTAQRYKKTIYIEKREGSEQPDFIRPLQFEFIVQLRDSDRRPKLPRAGQSIVNLTEFPVLNSLNGTRHTFEIGFNTRCGGDHVCETDLQLTSKIVNSTKEDDSSGLLALEMDETKGALEVEVTVHNAGKEPAYAAALYVAFEAEELNTPKVFRKGGKEKLSSAVVDALNDTLTRVWLGNPLRSNERITLVLVFDFVRGRTTTLARPLEFLLFANSSSRELNPSDDKWSGQLRLYRRAELSIQGVSEPDQVWFGQPILPLSSPTEPTDEEDIGPMVRHRYTVTNAGPWSVSDVVAEFQWPWRIGRKTSSPFALYLLDMPTVEILNTDNSKEIRYCSVESSETRINPLSIHRDVVYVIEPSIRRTRRSSEPNESAAEVGGGGSMAAAFMRSAPREMKTAQIDCNVASCVTVSCRVPFLDVHASAIITLRSRLWNASFADNYADSSIEMVRIVSQARLALDPRQAIRDSTHDNAAIVATQAYPDRPNLADSRPIPWWIYLIAILIGLLLLALVIYLLYRCGFFRRKRAPTLHKAQLEHEHDQWSG